MNRVDRLTAILLYLQGGKRTANEIAQRFEISRRTVLRDIQALSEMGIPIVADLGATGGYSLMPDYTLAPLALRLNEALLLRIALASLSQMDGTPFKQDRASLLAKVEALLPRRNSEELDSLVQVMSLELPERPYATPFLERLLESAREERWLEVTYRSVRGVSQQTILPVQVSVSAGLWYCKAYSCERQELRHYRVDRFLEVRLAEVAPEVDREKLTRIYLDPSFPEVRIQLTSSGVLRLERNPYLSAQVQRLENGEGLLITRLNPKEYDWLIRVLLLLGTDAQVIEPDTLRQQVARAAEEIVRHHSQK
uniref:DeoR family transcriptional regulator n=1 Tax=Thermosporothrix sp. COM3 TaxID=2490863 RepID=A0A455SRA3_9CHLR|nr:DeoR family transcriptional regulator [Thermosporothrix sp. COM3]